MSFIELLETLLIRILTPRPRRPRALPANGGQKADFIIGTTQDRTEHADLGITDEERRHHVYILGATGSGKSNLISRLFQFEVERWP